MSKTITIVAGIGLASLIISLTIEQHSNGEKIFQQNCASCHTIGNGKLTGPDLKGVTNRRSDEWLIKFIKSPRTLIKNKDHTAVKIFHENNKVLMPDQNLSDQQIREVLMYIQSKSNGEIVVTDTTAVKTGIKK